MTRQLLPAAGLALTLLIPAVATAQPATTDQKPVYGSQLMTEQERLEQRQRMRNATSAAEREQIRLEHHQRMQERARQQGVTLPEQAPAPGMGMGKGQGMGPGQGMGQGMGPKGGGQGPGK
jgi:hypothetical protein